VKGESEMTNIAIFEDRIAELQQALSDLLAALDAQDEDPSAYVHVDSARAAAVMTLENGQVRKPQPLPMSELIGAGYKPVPPTPGTGDADAEVVAGWTCDLCPREGLVYLPFSKNSSYRPFARCPDCGHAVEF
jgi:hypothetical protein